MPSPYIDVVFCDDARMELSHKFSLMGVYTSDLLFTSLPGTLLKLNTLVRIFCERKNPIKSATFYLYLDGEVLAETQEFRFESVMETLEYQSNTSETAVFSALLEVPMMTIVKDCYLWVKAITPLGEFESIKLRLGLNPNTGN